MAKAHEVLKHVSDFVEHRESLEALEDWSASYLRDVYSHGDYQDQQAILVVRSVLNAFEGDSDHCLRIELEEAMRPFEETIQQFVAAANNSGSRAGKGTSAYGCKRTIAESTLGGGENASGGNSKSQRQSHNHWESTESLP